MTTATAPKKAKLDPLDALAGGDPRGIIALMIWKNRLREPDMFVKIEEGDIAGFQDCVRYLKVVPDVLIERPAGLPEQAAIPATANRRAIPGRAATPPKPYVIVTLVEKGTKNMIRPVENNETDYDRAADVQKVRKARDQAGGLAQRLRHQAASGEYSLSDMSDAAEALEILARAV